MDFDARDDYDSRDDERLGPNGQRRGGSDNERDWDDWRQPDIASRDRDDDARGLGRGPTTRRSLLESHRDRDREGSQTFYAGIKRERELEHDVQLYRAFEREAERLEERGARIERVVLDYELKRDYQKWLHERGRDRDDCDGHPDRDPHEIEEWAHEHDLPYFDDQVHFPDVRIEYEDADGRWDHVDVEVTTVRYRGAHGSAAARSGFSCYGGSSARVGGGSHHGGLADELLR